MFSFDRVGRKIKSVTKGFFWFQVISYLIAGIICAFFTYGISLLVAIVAIVIVWISSWLLYGFGELVDKICDIEINTKSLNNINTFSEKFQPAYQSGSGISQSSHKANYLSSSTTQQRLKDKDIEEQNRIRKIRNLRMKGLISEEEYQEMMSNRR